MKFATKYEPAKSKPEKNLEPTKTEKVGYIPPKVQIERMIQAGVRLNEFRKGYEFEKESDVPTDYVDVTRNPNFDLADATQVRETVADKLVATAKDQKEAAEAKKKADAEKKDPPEGK